MAIGDVRDVCSCLGSDVVARGAAAYSLPSGTEVRALLPGAGGEGESSELAALLLMGVALIGAAWVARRQGSHEPPGSAGRLP